ncbi:MAG: glycosyltransferase [Bacteroidales bacterium]|jgi:UDP:flavonoid glycosyltransferase YjiC (YdhE family)|nr:glycosyltransferase [Bacteroidales bacterium]
MKIVLATRGSNGDIIPYLNLADSLRKQGHEVILNLPKVFEKYVIPYNIEYCLQDFEDLNGMVSEVGEDKKSFGVKRLLDWVKDSINHQFDQLIPLVSDCDLFISTNTEFSASSIAEYCQKPFVRTAFAPFLPGKRIPPPLQPYTKEDTVMVPVIWTLLNRPTNLMMSGAINKRRKKLGMGKVENLTRHLVANAYNLLLYSPSLGATDSNWKWDWDICGYCFNDSFEYDNIIYENLLHFIEKDDRPTIFFTFGSCSSKHGEQFVNNLAHIIKKNDYKLIVGSGWSRLGDRLEENEHLFLMKETIPHNLVFPKCDAVVHHGGTGTTHSVARQGKPQMLFPLILDQFYWGKRINDLKIGPPPAKIGKISMNDLEKNVKSLIENKQYQQNAHSLSQSMKQENAAKKFGELIERRFS